MGEKEPVIAIFVGTLSKMTYGTKSLSGGSACRWYIDEDVPDINFFRASLGGEFVPLAPYAASDRNTFAARVQHEPVDATVLELTNIDPFEDMNKRFHCVVTVDRVTADKRWLFASCSDCRKSARYIGNQYRCSDPKCDATDAEHAYCISVMATDGTAEAEFVLFDKVAAAAVGRSLVTLLQQRYPGHATIEEAALAARLSGTIPPDISRLVGQKYKLMVSIPKKSQFTNTDSLSFQINRIEKTFKPELPASVFGGTSLPGGSSSSSRVASGSITVGNTIPSASQSLAPQPHTPPPCGTSSSPLSPGKSSLGIKRGARRTLFSTPSSKERPATDDAASSKQVLDSAPDTEDVLDDDVVSLVAAVSETMETDVVPPAIPLSQALKAGAVSSVPSPEEKGGLPATSKNKRAAGASKGGAALKKTK